MILKVVTPEKENFDLSISFPKNYLGKKVHCLFYVEEEVNKVPDSELSNKKPSDFFGILSKEEGEKFHQHIEQIRHEWERNI